MPIIMSASVFSPFFSSVAMNGCTNLKESTLYYQWELDKQRLPAVQHTNKVFYCFSIQLKEVITCRGVSLVVYMNDDVQHMQSFSISHFGWVIIFIFLQSMFSEKKESQTSQ